MFTANLTYFQDNPWQPRKTMRKERLEELAVKIYSLKTTRPETLGLLQLPAARLVDGQNKPVALSLVRHLIPVKGDLTKFLKEQKFSLQLAWGHRRRAAFDLLTKGLFIPPLEGDTTKLLVEQVIADPDYLLFPFELVEFTDQEMFELAVTENGDRDDLTPIETAQAMVTYRDQFGKSSAEIGKLFGNLSGSTVRNMIRLLDLPLEPRQALADGRMSQGAGRALLTLYALPAEYMQKRAWGADGYINGESIVEKAINGTNASEIEKLIDLLIRSNAVDMSKTRWKHTDIFPETEEIHHPDCKTCPMRQTRNSTQYCLLKECYVAKYNHWQNTYLAEASRAADLPISTLTSKSFATTFNYREEHPVLDAAYTKRCPNLCLIFDEHHLDRTEPSKNHVSGFPGAEIICQKREQHCTCLQAHKTGVRLGKHKEDGSPVEYKPLNLPTYPEPTPVEPAPVELTEDDLKTANRQIREHKTQAKQTIATLRQNAADQLYDALSTNHLPTWKKLTGLIYEFRGTDDAADLENLFQRLAAHLVEREFKYSTTDDANNITYNERRIQDLLKSVKLAPVSTETPPTTLTRIDASQDGQIIATYDSLADVDQALLVPGTTLKAVYPDHSPNS